MASSQLPLNVVLSKTFSCVPGHTVKTPNVGVNVWNLPNKTKENMMTLISAHFAMITINTFDLIYKVLLVSGEREV